MPLVGTLVAALHNFSPPTTRIGIYWLVAHGQRPSLGTDAGAARAWHRVGPARRHRHNGTPGRKPHPPVARRGGVGEDRAVAVLEGGGVGPAGCPSRGRR